LLTTGADGIIFVGECEPANGDATSVKFTTMPRQRYTVAHELGHFIMHRELMGRFHVDTQASVMENREADTSNLMERQADYFAADLLMPAEVCRAREAAFRSVYKVCPRTPFAHRLASELLVSSQAMRYRLNELGVGDE
jgi:Zn-dependent peptidase ImmA (M78 family)